MICCTALVFAVAWLGLRTGDARARRAALRQQSWAWMLWGGGLGGLAYITVVTVLLATGAAHHVDDAGACGAALGARAVAVELIASDWMLRSMVLVGIAIASLALSLALFVRARVLPEADSTRRVYAGFALSWLVLSVADHQLFGLYALAAGGVPADLLLHVAGGLPWLAGALGQRKAVPPYSGLPS